MIGYPFNSHVEYDEHDLPVFDRAISSEPLKNLISKLFSNGVLPNPSTNLQVVSGGAGMTVIVKAGFCIINGGLKLEDEDKTLVVQASDATYPRIDTVVMRWNDNDDVRACDLYIVEGTPSASPVRPALTRTGAIYEIGLADIFITANSTSIDSFRITDTRLDSNRCGYISSISEFDTSTLYAQIQSDLSNFQSEEQADFLAWFEEMRDQLSEDAAGHLQNEIDEVNGRYNGLTQDISEWVVLNQLPSYGREKTLYLITGEEEVHYAGDVNVDTDVIDDNMISYDKAYSSSKVSTLLGFKVDAEAGKGLSANDFTNADKTKLDGLPTSFKTINGYNITGTGNIVIDGGASSAEYPEYARLEMEEVAAKIQNYINTLDNPVIIGFNTDPHIDPQSSSTGAVNTRNGVTYGLKTMRDLTKRFPFNMCVLGGDTHGGSSGTIAAMQESAIYITNQMEGLGCPLAHLVGNHEGGQDNQNITRDQVYKSHMTHSMQNKVITTVDRINGYYDDPSCKVRFIFLDAFPRTQVNYLAANINSVLNTMLSGVPEGYKAIIFSHHPLDETLPQNAQRTLWNNPTACHATLQAHKDKIIACFDGHVHNNLTIDQDGVRFVATTCSGKYELNDGSSRPTGQAIETAYDVFVIDTDEEIIHAIRYGNGEDRDIPYYHEVPPTPPEPRGNILSGVTWTDDTRLNSSGVLVEASGYSTTDFIADVNAGDTLYFADGTLPMSPSVWTLYNDDGSNGGSKSAISTTTYGATYATGSMYVGLYSNADGKILSATWYAINKAKNPDDSTYGTTRFGYGEIEFWESGYIKSVKLAYDGEHFQGTHKIRFTFPTAKKASLDIRVNEPFDED